jgi:hypothetical protein
MTDPRLDKATFFWDPDNPFTPDNLDYIGDINSGLSYKDTWAKLVTDPDNRY